MPYSYRDRLPLCSHAGVYAIVNKVNGKVYVGSALVVRARLHAHRSELRRGVHPNSYLQRAWKKHGEEKFRFTVLQGLRDTPELLIDREQFWMDRLESHDPDKGYNLSRVATAPMAGRKHTAEARAKMSAAQQRLNATRDMKALSAKAAEANRGKAVPEERKARIAAAHRGKPKTEEHKTNIKASHWSKRPDAAEISAKTVANRPKTLSPEHRKRISEGNYLRWKRVRDAERTQSTN